MTSSGRPPTTASSTSDSSDPVLYFDPDQHHAAVALQAAVAAGDVTPDDAKRVLSWIDPAGRLVGPTARAAAVAREVFEAAGIELPPSHDHEPPARPGATARTRETAPAAAPARSPERPLKGQSARNRPDTPSDAEPHQDAAPALRSPASRPAANPAAARSRAADAWATKNPLTTTAFLRVHAAAVLDLLAADAELVHGDELRELFEDLERVETLVKHSAGRAGTPAGSERSAVIDRIRAAMGVGERQMLDLVRQLPSTVEVAGEPLSVLAAAREALTPDRRTVAMLPTTPRVRVLRAPEDRDHLPDVLPDPTQDERQRVLPYIRPDRSSQVGPAPWLVAFDSLGGVSMVAGRGAPIDLRLFTEALASAPPAARAGRLIDVPLTVGEISKAVWPNGWQRGRDLPKLRNAMRAINALGFLTTPDGRLEWAPVLWRVIPGPAARLHDHALLQVQLPPSAGGGAGARFNRATARLLGVSSAPEFRAYLGLVHEWDRHLIRGVRPRPGHPFPAYSPADRRRLIFGDDPDRAGTRRQRQTDADRAFGGLAERGVIDLERDPRDSRIFIPQRRDLD